MKTPVVATVDFETKTIVGRPDYPPEPVGASIEPPGKSPFYMAWGHPTQNNCTKADAKKKLKEYYTKYPIAFHNAKFDLDVGNTHMGLPLVPKHGYHDTQFLAFLHDPHAAEIDLKSLARDLLGMPPEERDKLSEWIQTHVWLSQPFSTGEYEIRVDLHKPKGWLKVPPTKTGAFIYLAPGKLAGTYANGDTRRTSRLFRFYWDSVINEYGMYDAYMREINLMPVLLENERDGVRINERQLRTDSQRWSAWLEECDQWIRRRLKAKDLSIDSNTELADAMENAGIIGEWVETAKGGRSVSQDNLAQACTDEVFCNVFNYRSLLATNVRNFSRRWLQMASKNGGMIMTNWNQTRGTSTGGGNKGARTGRLSSNPNFQNIPKRPPQIVKTKRESAELKKLEIKHSILPPDLFKRVGPLPFMRGYIIPDQKGHVLLNRDYSQQELRILGHFENAVLLNAYNENPKMDLHQLATDLINEMLGTKFERGPIKNMGFGLIYGMGIDLLAESMGVDRQTAKIIKAAYLRIFPGLKALDEDLKSRGRMHDYIRTWGGRVYYVEPPLIFPNGGVRTFEYKLLNVLIQGSAADCTKEAMIRYNSIKKEGRLLLNVHDEIMLDAPRGAASREMKLLKEAMESVEFDVPMLSDGKMGTSWGKMRKCV